MAEHPDTWVVALDDVPADVGRLGGKGASLAELAQAGYRVPLGFVLSTDAFDATLDHLGSTHTARDLVRSWGSDEGTAAADQVLTALFERPLPAGLSETLLGVFQATVGLHQGANSVIVRSSATLEDSTSLSFAGMFESLLVERPEELESTVRAVWASTFSPRALSYMKESGLEEPPSMAVVIQPFLEATRSGVMFTSFEANNEGPRILIEHVEGGCEKLVKGEVTPSRIWLRSDEKIGEDLDPDLEPTHVRELARLASALETSMSGPQDVEWLLRDGSIWIVQSRRITVVASQGSAEDGIGRIDAEALLAGSGASAGTGIGPTHLVFNIKQALALKRGDVLVTPMTNPDMVVAMRNAAAIVTDVGGMICHAAIVSRELGLPCVVGTERATTTLDQGQVVTVDGSLGTVYDGSVARQPGPDAMAPLGWDQLWDLWRARTTGHDSPIPMVSTVHALEALPIHGAGHVVLVPDLDLRCTPSGLWNDLEALPATLRERGVDRYLDRVSAVVEGSKAARISLLPMGAFERTEILSGLTRMDRPNVAINEADSVPHLLHNDDPASGPAVVPLAVAASFGLDPAVVGRRLMSAMGEAKAEALDTLKFFGHKPAATMSGMPEPASRRAWWAALPEYGRYHEEFGTGTEHGRFEWLEVRPELVISALLKSLVQPGFEMVPRILGFQGLPPMHVKWIRCRYQFRADTFDEVWRALVRATWDEAFMADLMRRVRASYESLAEVTLLFPQADAELQDASGTRLVAIVTAWWPRWVEFFALCWFIQAQGDDIVAPFIEATVRHHIADIGPPPPGFRWPNVADFFAPTTPVMSAEYIADVGTLRDTLLAAGLTTAREAELSVEAGRHPEVRAQIDQHLRKWRWMRDRDLLFEPWDTVGRIVETALNTDAHPAVEYEANLNRNMLALAFHFELALASGRGSGLARAARSIHDLNVERENHHLLWLKLSHPLRRVLLELERRWIEAGSLEAGDVFFLQAPELIEQARVLPSGLPADLVQRVKNRRRGYLAEARLAEPDGERVPDEDDYL